MCLMDLKVKEGIGSSIFTLFLEGFIVMLFYNFILTSNCSQSFSVCMCFILQMLMFLGMYP